MKPKLKCELGVRELKFKIITHMEKLFKKNFFVK